MGLEQSAKMLKAARNLGKSALEKAGSQWVQLHWDQRWTINILFVCVWAGESIIYLAKSGRSLSHKEHKYVAKKKKKWTHRGGFVYNKGTGTHVTKVQWCYTFFNVCAGGFKTDCDNQRFCLGFSFCFFRLRIMSPGALLFLRAKSSCSDLRVLTLTVLAACAPTVETVARVRVSGREAGWRGGERRVGTLEYPSRDTHNTFCKSLLHLSPPLTFWDGTSVVMCSASSISPIFSRLTTTVPAAHAPSDDLYGAEKRRVCEYNKHIR